MPRASVIFDFRLLVGCVLAALGSMGDARAQITLDGSFGRSGSFAGPKYTIGADVGKLVGPNLFHSFGTFNVRQGETATFTGPGSVKNIIGRVTGGQVSNVNGQIASKIAGADLYLVNPSGWMFGPAATLNVPGSVHVSTADSVRFADGTVMPARSTDGSSLTIAAPTAFGFMGTNPGGITVNGSSLTPGTADGNSLVPGAGRDLSIVGGPVTITGASISTTAGKIRIVSAAGPGDVGIRQSAGGHTTVKNFGPVGISGTNVTIIDASSDQQKGGVRIQGGSVQITNKSQIVAANSIDANYATVSLHGDDVAVSGSKVASVGVGAGAGGAMKVKASHSVVLGADQAGNPAGLLSGTARQQTRSGALSITSGGTIILQPGGLVGSGAGVITGGPSNGIVPGEVSLQAPVISINGPSAGVGSTTGTGSSITAGAISLVADTITMTNGGGIEASAGGTGSSGSITISAHLLSLASQAHISTDTFGAGNAGIIHINGTGSGSRIVIDGSGQGRTGIFSEPVNQATGAGGQVSVQADSIELQGGQISSASLAPSSAGSVDVTAHQLTIDGLGRLSGAGGIFTDAELSAVTPGTPAESAGSITVTADAITLRNAAEISGSTFGNGNGGPVHVTAGSLDIQGTHSGIFSSAGTGAANDFRTGRGGEISIAADRLAITQGGFVSSTSSDLGQGGNILLSGRIHPLDLLVSGDGSSIEARASSSRGNGAGSISIRAGTIKIADQGQITTSAEAGGGGRIGLVAGQLIWLDQGRITTSVGGGSGNAGDIVADSRFVVLNRGTINANADAGRGGNIAISTQTYLASPDSLVQASAARGINGTIAIEAPQNFVPASLAKLSGSLLAPPALQQQGCSVVAESQGVSSLVVGTSGGLPRSGEGPQPASYFDAAQDPPPSMGPPLPGAWAPPPAPPQNQSRDCRR